MSLFKVLLWPFTVLYNLVMKVRNYLFDIGHKPSFKFDSVIISVGNLNVGGSGKTPMIEYLVRLLNDRYSIAILSRGYGRKTKGIRLATDQDDAATLGDEPFQYYRKFGSRITVCVGEERVLAIPTILNEHPETQIILLDDAFQHRSVIPQFSILLTEYFRPFYKDFLMPFGRLRESRSGANRADAIIVTKCADSILQKEVEEGIHRYAGDKPIFFSTFKYQEPVAFQTGSRIGAKLILVSGVANSTSLEMFVSTYFELVKHFQFGDHHFHSADDVSKIQSYAQEHKVDSILTTEKDMVKLISPRLKSVLLSNRWFYLPIETSFVKNGAEFDQLILKSVSDNLKLLNQ
jgi:tetraacyldisaccharide 4'-kinase